MVYCRVQCTVIEVCVIRTHFKCFTFPELPAENVSVISGLLSVMHKFLITGKNDQLRKYTPDLN